MTTYPQPEELMAKGMSWFEDESRWKKVKTQEGVDIYEGTEKSRFRQFRGIGIINKPFSQVLKILNDFSLRPKWNDKVIVAEVVEKFDDDHMIIHVKFNGSPVTHRDFCCYALTKITDEEFIEIETSVTHEKCPEEKGFVRAHAEITGNRLQKVDENNTRMTYMGQVDLAGMVPTFIANIVNQGQPMVIAALQKYLDTLPGDSEAEPSPSVDPS
ncbi:putative START domain containing protein [Blattamonas nauphoetae]|uniref:START domain containing protein n=1 Tax=Blattamonas nauphoetae TaxID=2049346 RepID=A0ABQ9X3Q8_9EUKA|nr:putative START domain containing protein [Blattamonas nauphoetae]